MIHTATSRRDLPLDIIADPTTGTEVWARWLWEGGKAYVITRRDPLHVCPFCQGEGHVTVLLDGHAPMIEQPEREETCSMCGGSSYVEALYGEDDDEGEKLLWPKSDSDSEVRE